MSVEDDLREAMDTIEAALKALRKQARTPGWAGFAASVQLYGAIGAHPDTLAKLKAAAGSELAGIRLVPLPMAERGQLMAGKLMGELARNAWPVWNQSRGIGRP